MNSIFQNRLYDWLTTACQLIVLGFLFLFTSIPLVTFWCFFYRSLSLHLTGTRKNFRSYLPGIFFRIQIQFFTMSCTDNPISFLRCCDGRRSFPGLYRQNYQSPAALFMDGNLPRSLDSRQLYLCRDIASARFISCRPSALRTTDGRPHQRNFHPIIYNGRRLRHRFPGSRTFCPSSRNPLLHRQPPD